MRFNLKDEQFLQSIIGQLGVMTKDEWHFNLSKDKRLISFVHTDKLNHIYTYSWMVDELDLARSDREIVEIVLRKIGTQKRDLTRAEKTMLEILK